MKKQEKIKVGISVGDLNGVGIEVILKTFEDSRMLEFCTPVVFGSSKSVSFHKKALGIDTGIHGVDRMDKVIHNKLNLLNVWKEMIDLELGTPTEISGKYAYESLRRAVAALKKGDIDVLVTAPIDKHNMSSEDFQFPGHTEYLEQELEGEALMILMTEELRVGLITGHLPLKEVAGAIDASRIVKKVEIMHQALKNDFSINKPRIAVLGLNPHCGDKGVIGTEDDEIVAPAIAELQTKGRLVYGPYAADGFFGSGNYKNFDGVMAMYHDQGLAPFKTIAFGHGVNFTAGLNKIRTSPDHGTAFDIAGQGKADHQSFREALFAAIELFKSRTSNTELVKNKLEIQRDTRRGDRETKRPEREMKKQ
jgi:4-hydroxythreonine-4-phosphate dehydrogenase